MTPTSFVGQHELANVKAEPVNVVRGIVNDVTDGVGIPRPEEVVPLPAEFARTVGVPTVEEAIPTPKEFIERFFGGAGRFPSPREVFPRF